ncbi:MAG: DUF1540 domain-containing protein [Firmicutes bacterium]|nr:DUF1540 domain-containing protein [Bacillota bacterium]
MPNIKCNVTECNFNQAVECSAPMIQVNRNNTGSTNNSDETKCETFKPKS